MTTYERTKWKGPLMLQICCADCGRESVRPIPIDWYTLWGQDQKTHLSFNRNIIFPDRCPDCDNRVLTLVRPQ